MFKLVDEILMIFGLFKCIVIWYWRIILLELLGVFYDICKEIFNGILGYFILCGGFGFV